MDLLIAEWKRQAADVMHKYGYDVAPDWESKGGRL